MAPRGKDPNEGVNPVATVVPNEVAFTAEELPEDLRSYVNNRKAAYGYFENVEGKDLVMPRFIVIQKTSDAAIDAGCAMGQMTVSSDFGKLFVEDRNSEEFQLDPPKDPACSWFVPTYRWKERIRFVKPYKAGTTPLCRSRDYVHGEGDPGIECAKCKFKDFSEKGDAPECAETILFAGLALAQGSANDWVSGILSCKSTHIRFARFWNTEILKVVSATGEAPFMRMYRIGIVAEQRAQGSSFGYELRKWPGLNQFARPIRDISLLRLAAETAENIMQQRKSGLLTMDERPIGSSDAKGDNFAEQPF